MRLAELIAGLPVIADGPGPEVEVRGVCHDSRACEPGDLFVSWSGSRHDGRLYAPQAVERGAVAVLASGPPLPGQEVKVPWLTADDPRRLLGPLASRAYDHPDRELVLAGVTGTNGKSTVATLIAAALDGGFIGTLGYRFRGTSFPGERTSPEASDLFRTLRQMRRAGARAVAMEVSSHALAQGRVDGASFDVAVFTNLTRDHLDFHLDMEGYFAAKRELFSRLKPGGRPVVNVEDGWGRRLAGELPAALTYGEGGEIAARDVVLDTRGIRATVATPRGNFALVSPLLGRFNLSNLLAAVAAGEALGLPHAALAAAFAAQQPVPGRMEPVDRGQPFAVFIDYAHTDAALDAALRSAREIAHGKLAVVFGCGGERDTGKRPVMGRIAGELADLVIATSDNPRREDPLAILAAVEAGIRESGRSDYRVIPDRREAIRAAVAAAEEGWIVLVAGKGHEAEQIVGDRKLPFSDWDEVVQALEERRG